MIINHIRFTEQPYDHAKPVGVYWNFHRKCYSVKQNRLVIGYSNCISLVDAKFTVSEAGRQRVLRERKKNVHACVTGTLRIPEEGFWDVKIRYNPYKDEHFCLWVNPEVTIKAAKAVLLITKNNSAEMLISKT